MIFKYYVSYCVIYYYCVTFITLSLLCHTFMLHNCYTILHELHFVILFNLSLCVTFLHNFSAYFSHDDLPKYLIIAVYYKTLDFQFYTIIKQGNRYIVIVMDYFTKWSIAKALKEATTRTVSKFIYKKIICEHRCLEVLQNNRGMNFVNRVIEDLTKKFRIKHRLS